MMRLRASTLWRDGAAQRLGVRQVADAHAAPRDLVLVGRADAARRRPDLALAAARLAQQIELAVIRQDQVRLVADEQPVADVDAGRGQLVDLGEQRLRIDHDAVADDAGDARRAECPTAAAAARTSGRWRRPCARRCARPDSARRSRSSASADRRSCPCPRRPTGRPEPRCSLLSVAIARRASEYSSPPDGASGRLVADVGTAARDRRRVRARRAGLRGGARRRGRARGRRPPRRRRRRRLRHQHRLWLACRGEDCERRARRAAAQPAAQPCRWRRRAAAGPRRAGDDRAARQRAGKGLLGIRVSTLERLLALLNARVHPLVPSRGSVGASGDLAPLAHLSLVLIGEGQATVGDDPAVLDGAAALARAGLAPVALARKRGPR